MKRIALATLVVMSIVCGLPAAQAAETLSGADRIEPPPLHTTNSQSNSITSTSQPLSNHTDPLAKSAAPDCDGEAPATGSVTALLSRFVRSSSVVRGKQCPMPPILDQSTIQETRP